MSRFSITILLYFTLPLNLLAQSIQNISLLAQVEYEVELSDIWGYTDENGREYALVGLETGTSIVDIGDPSNPKEIARIPGGQSFWKDIKTYKNRAFITGEYEQGLQIVDLSNLPNGVDSTQSFFWQESFGGLGRLGACHNLYIEEKTGVAYLSGCSIVSGGILMFDITGELPVYLGKTNTTYSHDVYVRNDTIYSSDMNLGVFSIIDATNKNNPVVIANQRTPLQFTHNTWLSDDSKTIYTTDETGNAPVAAYDISDVHDIKALDQFYPDGTRGTGLIPHNVHVKNDFLVTSYYAEGVVITDASRPNNLVQVGKFDTYQGPNASFYGAWGAFPFFESDIILVTDIENGLFILRPNYLRAAFFEGMVTDSISGAALSNVQIDGVNRGVAVFESQTGIDGSFEVGTTQTGNLKITFSKEGYHSETATVRFANGTLAQLSINLAPIDSTDNTTSLESLALLTAFDAAPNPFLAQTTIQYTLAPSIKNAQFVLTDIAGKLVQQFSLVTSEGLLTIDLSLEKGLYFGQIITSEGKSGVLKLVQQ